MSKYIDLANFKNEVKEPEPVSAKTLNPKKKVDLAASKKKKTKSLKEYLEGGLNMKMIIEEQPPKAVVTRYFHDLVGKYCDGGDSDSEEEEENVKH
jgi:hypothetical protein